MSTVTLRIGASIEVDARELGPVLTKTLTESLTHPNPAWERAARMRRRDLPPATLRYYRRSGDIITAPRGTLGLLREMLTKAGHPVQFSVAGVVTRSAGARSISEINVNLRDYQLDAVRAMCARVQGIVRMPCGAGKTTTGAAAAIMTGEPTIVLVHTRDIRDQWLATFERLSGVRPRLVTSDENGLRPLAPREVAVGMIQTLSRAGHKAAPLLQSAGAMLTDEAHHVPAETWAAIAEQVPARFRWGLTATPDRSDGLTFVLAHLIGPTVFAITTAELIRRGYLLKPTIVPVATGWNPTEDHYPWSARCPACARPTPVEDTSEHRRLGTTCRVCRHTIGAGQTLTPGPLIHSRALSDLTSDPKRSNLVRLLAEAAARAGRTALVLIPRKEAAVATADAIRERGVNAVAVTGDSIGRSAALESVRSGAVPVIVATQLADEGLDLPQIDVVINAAAGRSQGRAKQRVGRSLRLAGRNPVVFELVDGGEFESQWRSRFFGYIAEYGRNALAAEEPVTIAEALAILRRVDARECHRAS